MLAANEGIELLYTRDCRAWPEALANLEAALDELGSKEEVKLVVVDTLEQAHQYCFFASPTIHLDGQDIDHQARRITKHGLGCGRPYFWGGRSWSAPPRPMIIEALRQRATSLPDVPLL